MEQFFHRKLVVLPALWHHDVPQHQCAYRHYRGNLPVVEDSSSEEKDDIALQLDQLQNLHEYKLKIDIPTFDGCLNIEEVLDWVQTTEAYFEYMKILENKEVKYVAYKLKAGMPTW